MNVLENRVQVATSQQVARSDSSARLHVVPAQYADAGSGKPTTAELVRKPNPQANCEHANSVASTAHSPNETAPAAAAFVFSGQLVQAPTVPTPSKADRETQLSFSVQYREPIIS